MWDVFPCLGPLDFYLLVQKGEKKIPSEHIEYYGYGEPKVREHVEQELATV